MKCSYDIWKEVERRRDEASARYEELRGNSDHCVHRTAEEAFLLHNETAKQLGRLEALDGLYRWLEVK